ASAAAGHRAVASAGTAGARVGADSAQYTHPGADPFCGCHLDHPGTARGLAPARHRALRPAQLCAREEAQDQESGVSDALVRFCWSQCTAVRPLRPFGPFSSLHLLILLFEMYWGLPLP